MKLFKFVLLCLFLISPAKADTIYELIKIPNLEIYNIKTENKLRYLNAKQAFTIGIDNNINFIAFYCIRNIGSTLSNLKNTF